MLKEKYIRELLFGLKTSGYDAVMIEIADKLIFPSNKYFASADAFDARKWFDIIGYGISIGLTIYPLLQTLGHLDHILRHDEYSHLVENIGKPYLMCASNSESLPFLYSLIDDLKTIFHNPSRIHLGGDEVQTVYKNKNITKCPECNKKNPHKLQVKHLSSLAKKALEMGMIPEFWGDDILRNPKSSNDFPKEAVFVDWFYDRTTQYQDKTGHIWGHLDLVSKDISQIKDALPEKRKCLLPYILNEKNEFNNFYGLDYFSDNDYNTIACSAVRSGYDSFAIPRTINSIKNVSLTQKLSSKSNVDHLVTSWSVRRSHPETTWPGIMSAVCDDISIENLTASIGTIPKSLEDDLIKATDAIYTIDHLNADDMRFNIPFHTKYFYYIKQYSSIDEYMEMTNRLSNRIISINKIINHLASSYSDSIITRRKDHYINGLKLMKLRCEQDLNVIKLYKGVTVNKSKFKDLLEKSIILKKEFINLWGISTPEYSLHQEVDIKFNFYEKIIGSLINRF